MTTTDFFPPHPTEQHRADFDDNSPEGIRRAMNALGAVGPPATLAETLTRKLDFWEANLRSNRATYAARTDRDYTEAIYGIDRELGMIDAVRDVIDPGWSDR